MTAVPFAAAERSDCLPVAKKNEFRKAVNQAVEQNPSEPIQRSLPTADFRAKDSIETRPIPSKA